MSLIEVASERVDHCSAGTTVLERVALGLLDRWVISIVSPSRTRWIKRHVRRLVYGDVMEKTTLYLSAELQAELRAAARREGRPQAELVREALDAYLRDRPRPRPQSVGMLEDPEMHAEDAKRWVRERWTRTIESR